MPPLRHVLLVLLGGSLGALARAALSTAIATPPLSLPLATLVVNVSGAWLLAVLLGALATRLVSEPTGRLLLGTGVLGSFTTYSTLAVEVDGLLRAGAVELGLGYAALTVLLGLAAAWIGLRNGRRLDVAITRRTALRRADPRRVSPRRADPRRARPRRADRRVPSDERQRS